MGDTLLLRLLLLLVSGAGALAFEMAAVRAFSSRFGSTVEAVGAVTAVFLGLLALGAWIIGRWSDRSHRPGRIFGVITLIGGAVVCLTPGFLLPFSEWIATTVGQGQGMERMFTLAVGALCTVGLPAFFLGGTIPSLVAATEAGGGKAPGLLYAANTLGSVLGLALAGFFLLEQVGVQATMLAAGVVLLLVGGVGLLVVREEVSPATDAETSLASGCSLQISVSLWLGAASAGFSALALEVLGTRLLIQFLQSSAHSFALVLGVYLLGSSVGAVLGARLSERTGDLRRLLVPLLTALGVAISLAAPLIVLIARTQEIGQLRGLVQQATLSLALLPAPVISGMIFAYLIGRPFRSGRLATHVGLVTLFNTIGGISGSMLAAFFLVPRLGVVHSLLLAALVPIGISLFTVTGRRMVVIPLGGAALVFFTLLVPDLRVLPDVPGFSEVEAFREGRTASVAVLRAPNDPRPVLFVNRVAQGGGTPGMTVERRQGLLPSLFHNSPRSALVLGVGTGATVSGLIDAGTRTIHAVEIVDGVIDVLPLFQAGQSNLLKNPAVQFFREDAVTFVRNSKIRYDLIVGDLYFPWMDGTGRLYSEEHFRSVRDRLQTGGMFWQWIPMHQLRWEDFGLIARTFARVFPQTWLVLADARTPHPLIALVGSLDPVAIDVAQLEERIKEGPSSYAYRAADLEEVHDALELFLGDQYTIEAAFGGTKAMGEANLVNTMDRPVLEYRAARTTESESVLALTNLNLLALELGGSMMPYLQLPPDLEEVEKSEFEVQLNRRANALIQYLLGRYWAVRSILEPDDQERYEEHEAIRYLSGLQFVPTHPLLNEAVSVLAERRLRDRRWSEVVALAGNALALNPHNVRLGRAFGIAQLLLGNAAGATLVFEDSVLQEPDEASNHMLLGMAQYLDGKDEEARSSLSVAFQIRKEDQSRLAVAMSLALQGDPGRAMSTLEGWDPPLWGILAERARVRFQEQMERDQ